MASSMLLVDRDLSWISQIAESVRPYLLKIYQADSPTRATEVLRRRELELVVLDEGVLSISDFVSSMRCKRRPVLVVTTDRRDYGTVLDALRHRAVDVLHRPVEPSDLVTRIAEVLEDRIASPHYLGRRLDGYIRDNCRKPEMDLGYVSSQFGISKSYASLLLRSGHWGGFSSRLAHHRASMACRLLADTDDSLSLIAGECGFSSPSRLSETFSRQIGMTPKRYRERRGSKHGHDIEV